MDSQQLEAVEPVDTRSHPSNGEGVALEGVVYQVAEAVLATTAMVEQLTERLDTLANQVQQQGYQIFALSDTVQTMSDNQDMAIDRLDRLTTVLEQFVQVVQVEDGEP